MSGWDPMNHAEWAKSADALTAAAIEWPHGLAAHDLRWWAARSRLSGARFPTERDLAARWGWSTRQVRKLRNDVPGWADPKFLAESRAMLGAVRGRAPSWMREAEQERSRPVAEAKQKRSSDSAQRAASGPDSKQERSGGGAEAEQNRSTTRAFPSTDPQITVATPPNPPGPVGPGGLKPESQQALVTSVAEQPAAAPDPWEHFSTRAANALQAGGIAAPEALASHSRVSLRRLPNVGASTIGEAEKWLGDNGLSLRPDPPRRQGPCADPRAKVAGDAWKRAYRQVLSREPAWHWTPTGDPKHLVELASTFGVKADHDANADEVRLLERACSLYVRAANAGEAFPHGEPPALRHLARDGPQWLERARSPATHRPRQQPGRRQPDAGFEQTLGMYARIVEDLEEGHHDHHIEAQADAHPADLRPAEGERREGWAV